MICAASPWKRPLVYPSIKVAVGLFIDDLPREAGGQVRRSVIGEEHTVDRRDQGERARVNSEDDALRQILRPRFEPEGSDREAQIV